MASQEAPASQRYIRRGYEDATAWLEHAADHFSSHQPSLQTILQDCSQARQCVSMLSNIETNNIRLHALNQLAGMLDNQVQLLQGTSSCCTTGRESPLNSSQQDPKGSSSDLELDDRSKSRKAAIMDTIMQKSGITFKDVAGLTEAKQALREAIILPTQYPHLFTGGRKPWRRILLYGPPGTGKTRLAQAVSGEIRSSFYCVSSSDLLSSWVGESEKIIKELFSHARQSAGTSVVFIDEVDCVCRQRSSREEEHTRRIKTELLRQMEGADSQSGGNSSEMFLLCATNCPWELDSAFIRRFQKRIYIPLPSREVRLSLLKLHLSTVPVLLSEMEWELLAGKTEGYSGSDLATFCAEASMVPMREMEKSTHWKIQGGQYYIPCSPTDENGKVIKFTDLPPNQVLTRKVILEDCLKSLQHNHCTVSPSEVAKFEEYTRQSGQNG